MVFKKTKCVILSIVCVLFIYIFLGEPNLFEVVYLENTVEEGIRVVFFADLHLYFLRGFHERILEKIKSLNPDVIIFGGDALSYRTNVKDLEIFFSGIVDIAPIYTIFGNWEEHAPYHMKERYKDLGIFLLENTSTVFEAKGEKILLTGTESHYYFPVTEFPDTSEFLKSILMLSVDVQWLSQHLATFNFIYFQDCDIWKNLTRNIKATTRNFLAITDLPISRSRMNFRFS